MSDDVILTASERGAGFKGGTGTAVGTGATGSRDGFKEKDTEREGKRAGVTSLPR
jgi:hypothetical protein